MVEILCKTRFFCFFQGIESIFVNKYIEKVLFSILERKQVAAKFTYLR